jgi:putative PIN family toxin of toxin-antitoxin system
MARPPDAAVTRAAPPPGVVFDCNILLQATVRSTGPAFACLESVEAGLCTLYVSPATMAELDDVLRRPAVRRKFSTLSPALSAAFLSHLADVATFVEDIPVLVDFARDPKDAPYLNLALATHASYLISRDNDLLALASLENSEGRAFQARFPHLTILDPASFLRVLQPGAPERTGKV